MQIPREIFKAYDIRGIVGTQITVPVAEAIGRALGSMAAEAGSKAVAVGRDGRLSGPELSAALARGIAAAGPDVIDIGMVTTPMAYFAGFHLQTGSAVAVTGSHNPPDYNGLKMVISGTTLSGDAIQGLRARIEQNRFTSGRGDIRTSSIDDAYVQRIASDVRLARPMRLAIDCGNGVAGAYAGRVYRALGCEVEELYCEVDGTFPNHHPDPSQPDNLQALIRTVRGGRAELGFAFDGDGDRLGVVTRSGAIIYADRQLMLFARDVLSRNGGAPIIYDVKCTRNLAAWIRGAGGEPVMWRTGHSLIKSKMKETHAPLAGEMSGHIFFAERWYGFDDGIYAGARLLEILSREHDPSAVLEALPDSQSTPELNVKMREGEPAALIGKMQQESQFPGATQVIRIDGLRVEYPDGFGLARSSNTTPVVVLRFEGDTAAALDRIKNEFRRALLAAKPDMQLPF